MEYRRVSRLKHQCYRGSLMTEIRAVRGMRDLYGTELALWSVVESQVKRILDGFGYHEIRTPVLEKKEVFTQTVGEDTDIVEKQMYMVDSKDEDKLVLRPEGTASFMRAIVEHQLHQTGQPQRYYYYLPMFRYERPQKGRLRQFHQFGAELILDPSPEADAEIIILLDEIYKSFGISEFSARINSVGCEKCRPVYKEVLKAYFKPQLASLCEQCQKRFERAPMRILDCKKEGCKALAEKAPKITESLCVDCKTHHETLKKRLKQSSVNFVDDPSIVRGLDYYCRTAFEFTSTLLGAQDALCGGGRYNGLSERFGAKTFPGVGFGLGMERLIMAVEEKLASTVKVQKPLVYLAPLGEAAREHLIPMGFRLKRKGIRTAINFDPEKGLKALLKDANRVESRYAVILGEDELKQKSALIKDMVAGNQETVELSSLESELIRRSTLAT
jgi:histidyl-tRNA synthetase